MPTATLLSQATLVVLTVAGCAAQNFERGTPAQLRRMLAVPPACQEQHGIAGWYVDADNCARKGPEQRAQIRAVLERLHAAELAAAPACVRAYHPTATALRDIGVDPDSADPGPELVSRGVVTSALTEDPQCVAAICAWQSRYDPGTRSSYCGMARVE